jgi:hypothetical protein
MREGREHGGNTIKSISNLLENVFVLPTPHSLSYQATIFTKFLLREIPAFASKMEEWVSPFKSVETTSSSVYERMPEFR